MIEWIMFIAIYLIIGVGLLIWIVKTDKYGGFVLHVWWLVVFFYPYIILRNIISGGK